MEWRGLLSGHQDPAEGSCHEGGGAPSDMERKSCYLAAGCGVLNQPVKDASHPLIRMGDQVQGGCDNDRERQWLGCFYFA